MPNKMLIDASHPEETRVVVTRGNRIEEFDFESQDKKQLKGNIYLARVTRVEPSLQAAFVEYGGNRHGFLAFSEIHPDYYQIPVADRQALLRAEAEAAEDEDDDEADSEERGRGRRRRRGNRHRDREDRQAAASEASDTGEASDAGIDGEAADSDVSDGDVGAADRRAEASAETADDETAAIEHETSVARTETAETAAEDADTEPDYHHLAANADAALPDADIEPAAARMADNENEPGGEPEEAAPIPGEEREAAGRTDEFAVPVDESSVDEPPVAAAREDDEEDAPRPTSIAAAVDADVVSEELRDPAAGEEAVVGEDDRGLVEEVPGTHADDSEVESVGAEDALEEVRNRRRPVRRNYKIQEVIKRRQILLVQVVKEERGNKGAALTTYLSLAGRYSVLMPNTARGGGISRKITNAQDRKRLKEVVADLDVPQGMGVILRTAGESRTKAEIKRDYEYLMRLWENVRSLTLQSTAPALVYEEGSLIKRSVRDLYNKDIDEILVAGEEGYREAKDFMRMLMPSHAKVVQPYRDTVPILARSGIEAQLDKMLQPQVTLKSGGYIIINQTEALVAIDVNSGRSTKEHSIEDTALQTNLEAAEEVSRQLRLRDLAGLIVIDFIDMEENRNNRSVEKRLKDCLKNDRARIQVGRISHFGLLEMSRQRIRASVLESTMKPCPHCGGTGHVRSDSSVALHVVRAIEEFLLKDSRNHITVKTPTMTALYVLNHKRSMLVEMERRFGVTITLEADETLGAQPYAIVRGAVAEKPLLPQDGQVELLPSVDEDDLIEVEVEAAEETDGEPIEESAQERDGQGEQHQRDRKRRRRRRRRGGERDHEHRAPGDTGFERDAVTVGSGDAEREPEGGDEGQDDPEEQLVASTDDETSDADQHADGSHKKRRRGKRGGRRNRPVEAGVEAEAGASEAAAADDGEDEAEGEAIGFEAASEEVEEVTEVAGSAEPERPSGEAEHDESPAEAPAPKVVESSVQAPAKIEAPAQEPVAHESAAAEDDSAPIHRTRRRPGSDIAGSEPIVVSSTDTPVEEKPKKGGWWQRKGFF